MASFLAPNQSVQFSQYIPEIDPQTYAQTAEVYQKAIIQKQQSYDQGIARVQGVLDQVAGLSVAREEDKQYLDNKLGQLRTQVQQLARGADFSQMSTFNQVAGLASQVYSDKRIQKDVISAKNYADASAQIQKAHEDGKSAPSNDNVVLRNIEAWQRGGSEASLGKQTYTDYYNYSKSWQDYMSGKHANTVYWETDGSSQSGLGVAYTINQGKKIYLDPATVQRDFQTFLQMDQRAAQQVQFDSLYYADKTPNEVALEGLRSNVQSTLSSYNRSLEILEQQKASLTSTSDLAQLNEKIRTTQAERDKYQLRLSNGDIEREFLNDAHSAKMQMFTHNLIVGAANRYAYSEVENKTVKNPELDARIDETRLGIAQAELQLSFNRDRREELKASREAAEAQGLNNGVNLTVQGINPTEPATPENILSGIQQMGKSVVQDQLEALYNTGNMDSLVTIGSDGTYRLAPGKNNTDFAKVWNDVIQEYYKKPEGAKASIRKYMEAEDNPDYGRGRNLIYQSRLAEVNKIESELDSRFASDPNYRNYLSSVQNIGNLNEELLNENGISITRDDLLKFRMQLSKNNDVTWKPEKVAKQLGISEEKVKLLGDRTFGAESIFLKYTPLEQEWQRLSNVTRPLVNTQYAEQRRRAFERLAPLNNPTISYSSNAEGPDKKRNADLQSALLTLVSGPNRDTEREALTEVLNAKTKGDNAPIITVGATRDGVTGQVKAFVSSTASETPAIIDIGPDNARRWFPNITQLDPNEPVNADLRAQQKSPNQETTTTSTFNPTVGVSNLKNYSLRYKIQGNPTQGQYTPRIEFYRQGTNNWEELGYGGTYFSSPQQVKQFIDKIASQGDAYFERTFLSE